MIIIPKHKKGDYWDGMSITVRESNGTPVNLTGYTIRLDFVNNRFIGNVMNFTTVNNTITIPTPSSGKMFFNAREMNVSAFKYLGDLKLINPSGHVKTIANVSWEIWT